MTTQSSEPVQRPGRARRRALGIATVLVLAIVEVFARYRLARPLGVIRHSSDAEMVYENVPGTFVGRPTYDVWKAPMFMIWDLARTTASPPPTELPPGSALYRIDSDGCRGPSAGPLDGPTDVVVAGSSQAFGMLLPEEDAVPGMLERSLRARGFPQLRVANCSVVGHRFLQSLRAAERAQAAKHASVAVLLVRPWHMTEPFPYADVMAPQNRLRFWAIQVSGIARLVHYLSWRHSPYPVPLTPERVAARLDVYARRMREAGVRSVFFLLDDHTPDCAVFDGLVGQLRARGLAAERIDTPSGPREMFLDPDRHWSVRGGAYTTGEMVGPVQREIEAARATH